MARQKVARSYLSASPPGKHGSHIEFEWPDSRRRHLWDHRLDWLGRLRLGGLRAIDRRLQPAPDPWYDCRPVRPPISV